MLLVDSALLTGALLVLTACGWWAVHPWRDRLPSPWLVAPLAGLALFPMVALALNDTAHWPLAPSAAVAIVVLSGGSIAPWGRARALPATPRPSEIALVGVVMRHARRLWPPWRLA